jgi:capsular exopolysaccharide synthesis family protein
MPALTNNKYPLITEINPDSAVSEAYRSLRTNIQFASIDDPVKVILIAPVKSDEGTSEMVANLAVTYALEKKNVLIIDANLRNPTLNRYFSTEHRRGLTDVLTGQNSLNEVIAETDIPNISIIASGASTYSPSELLGSKRMYALLGELKEMYDIVLIESSPVLSVTDSQVLSAMCDGVVVVVAGGKVKREEGKKALSQLEYVKAQVLGVVLKQS